jgi:hypothetical protein
MLGFLRLLDAGSSNDADYAGMMMTKRWNDACYAVLLCLIIQLGPELGVWARDKTENSQMVGLRKKDGNEAEAEHATYKKSVE